MSISSSIVSFISYFQNVGCTISLPSIDLPDEIQSVLNAVRNFLATVQNLIPSIPKFDMRFQLIIMSLGIPLILDIFFVWFVQPVSTTIFHMIDIAAFFAFFMFIAQGFIGEFEILEIAIPIICGIWTVGRWGYLIFKRKKGKLGLLKLCRNICNHFLSGIIPGLKLDTNLNDLNLAIQSFSTIIEIKPQPVSTFSSVALFLLGAILLLVSLWCNGILPIPFDLPSSVCHIFPYIGYPFCVIFFLIFALRLFPFGRKFILAFKQFCKRWGLRLLMLALDMLYIPILTSLVSHIMVTKSYTDTQQNTCKVGEYLKILPSKYDTAMDYLVTHDTECTPCNSSIVAIKEACKNVCNGNNIFRTQDDPSLAFHEDIWKVSGGFLFFGFGAVMIGIPLLWFYIINRNKSFAYIVNVYGDTPYSKWLHLTNRMKTTGIFLFVNYKYNRSIWSVVYLGVKFLVMLITTVSGRLLKPFVFALPVFYCGVFIMLLLIKPYEYFFNNVLDIVLYCAQFLYAIIPCLAYFNVNLPAGVAIPFTVIVCVVPVVSIIFLLFFKRKSVNFDDDPTYPQTISEEEEKELEQKRKKAMKNDKQRNLVQQAYFSKIPKNYPLKEIIDQNSSTKRVSCEHQVDKNIQKSTDTNLFNSSSNKNEFIDRLQNTNESINNESTHRSQQKQEKDKKKEKKKDKKSYNVLNLSSSSSSSELDNDIFLRGVPSAPVPVDSQSEERFIDHTQNPDLTASVRDSTLKSDSELEDINNSEQNDQSSYNHYSLENNGIPSANITYSTYSPPLAENNYEYQNQNIYRPDSLTQTSPISDLNCIDREKSMTEQSTATSKRTTNSSKKNNESYEKIPKSEEEETNEKENCEKLVDLDDNEFICWIPEDEYILKKGDLDTVAESIAKLKKGAICPDDSKKVVGYSINKRVLASRMTSMYEMLDVVVDGSTIDFLTLTLNIAIMFGCGAFGWYCGALLIQDSELIRLVCD